MVPVRKQERNNIMSNTEKNRPVTEIRVGSVKIAIWKRPGDDGPLYTAGKPRVSYRDRDGNWHNDTASYGERDLVNLATAALQARAELARLRRTDTGRPDEDEG